jgi:bacillopeptidase F
MIKWGIPLFVRILAGDGFTVDKTQRDIIPPQPPTLSALAEATNSSSLTVEGYTEGKAKLELLLNDVLAVSGEAKEDGSFSLIADIKIGSNRIQVRAVDESGNASMSEIKLVNLDKEPIILTVASPKDGTEYFGKNSQTVEIVGKVNKTNPQIVANNSFIDVNRDGTFVHKLLLSSGENIIKIVATDKAGNLDEESIKVTYTP